MKRDVASTIFRTVVFAGAMLGSSACSKKHPATTPPSKSPTTDPAKPGDPAMMKGNSDTAKPKTDSDDPCAGADPCANAERPRGSDDDGGGGMGRGFVLS